MSCFMDKQNGKTLYRYNIQHRNILLKLKNMDAAF